MLSALSRFVKKKNTLSGFTLIELLVVISIIAILTAVATVSYLNVQTKSRDGKRKSDLAAVQSALEQFRSVNGFFPDENVESLDLSASPPNIPERLSCIVNGHGADESGKTFGYDPFICTSGNGQIAQTYMKMVPNDPIASGTYHRFIYEVYEHKKPSDTSAPEGWCSYLNPNYLPSEYLYGHCAHYTLWAGLENANDPEVLRTLNDPICQLSITYESSAEFSDWAHSTVGSTSGYGDHALYTGWANYCVHD